MYDDSTALMTHAYEIKFLKVGHSLQKYDRHVEVVSYLIKGRMQSPIFDSDFVSWTPIIS